MSPVVLTLLYRQLPRPTSRRAANAPDRGQVTMLEIAADPTIDGGRSGGDRIVALDPQRARRGSSAATTSSPWDVNCHSIKRGRRQHIGAASAGHRVSVLDAAWGGAARRAHLGRRSDAGSQARFTDETPAASGNRRLDRWPTRRGWAPGSLCTPSGEVAARACRSHRRWPRPCKGS